VETRRDDPALEAGLYLVSTPLGNARDITLRTLDLLAMADVLAAEDTRSLRRLMEIHGVPLEGRKITAYHDHNGEARRPGLVAAVVEGKAVVYASEAGTPAIADPGFALARDVIAAGGAVFSAPGPTAAIAALTSSGLPSDRFLFAGFPPTSAGARRSFLEELSPVRATLVLYESPKRLGKLLDECARVLGEDRRAVVCRELTKRYEEITRGSLGELVDIFSDRTVKGEIVVCIEKGTPQVDAEGLEEALRHAMETLSLKDAAREVAEEFGVSRRDLYQMGLALGKNS